VSELLTRSWDDDCLDPPPPEPGEKRFWGAHPADELAYQDFIRSILASASTALGTGITNAVLDWTSGDEDTPVLRGEVPGGWADPDCLDAGGVSRVRDDRDALLQEVPAHVRILAREFSFVTLDAPTWIEDRNRRDGSLYTRLIKSLVELEARGPDDLYTWLDRICAFCAGDPLAYLSRYRPSATIGGIARAHHVTLQPLPLRTLHEGILAPNQRFRLLQLAPSQWLALERRLRHAGKIEETDLLRRHREGG
jgi:hypothetical protein